MVHATAFILVIVLSFIVGLAIGKIALLRKSSGLLRMVADENGEMFMFLEFNSDLDKARIETLTDGDAVIFQVSHK